MTKAQQTVEVTATVGVEGGKPVLRVKGLTIPLTVAQLLHLVVGTAVAPESPRCQQVSDHGLPCLKDRGHKDRHHFVHKVYKRGRKPQALHAPSSMLQKRKAKGLCAWCDNKPVEGKKLCADHLVGARKQQRKMISKKRRAA